MQLFESELRSKEHERNIYILLKIVAYLHGRCYTDSIFNRNRYYDNAYNKSFHWNFCKPEQRYVILARCDVQFCFIHSEKEQATTEKTEQETNKFKNRKQKRQQRTLNS